MGHGRTEQERSSERASRPLVENASRQREAAESEPASGTLMSATSILVERAARDHVVVPSSAGLRRRAGDGHGEGVRSVFIIFL